MIQIVIQKNLFLPVFVALFAVLTTGTEAVEGSRYVMSKVENGFLRLDSQSGAVSFCSQKEGEWSCAAVDDDKVALQKQIEKLVQENAELKVQINALEELVTSGSDEGSNSAKGKPDLKLPSDEDVDKVMGFVENLLRRFKDMAKKLKKEDESAVPL